MMKTNVKKLTDTTVELTITVGKSELEDAEKVALVKLAKEIKAPGFRKGKVPASVAAKHVDPNVLTEETLNNALSKAVSQAFLDQKIQALDRPQVEIKKFIPSQELEFTAETEVMPEVKLGKYKKMGVKREVGKVDKKDIDDVIERMRKGLSERKAVKREAKNDDETVIDFVGSRDGTPFSGGAAQDYTLTLGSGQFIPGFEEGVVGHKAGDKFEIPLTFPEDYHSKELAGADVVFEVTLKEVKELKLPDLDDKFAKKAGPFKSFKELSEDIKRELTTTKEREADDKLKSALVEKLVKNSHVPVPQILVDDQKKSIEQDFAQNLAYQGLTLQSYLESKNLTHDEWLKTEVMEAAENRVKSGLVLAELSKVEKINASDEELAAKINEYQERYGNKSNEDFTTPEIQRDIANRLLTDKTIERLVELNK